jgi:hypothetical protein
MGMWEPDLKTDFYARTALIENWVNLEISQQVRTAQHWYVPVGQQATWAATLWHVSEDRHPHHLRVDGNKNPGHQNAPPPRFPHSEKHWTHTWPACPKHKIVTLRSGTADYVIFLTTFYCIIFWWWSCTCNSDQNVSIEHDFKKKLSNLPPQTLISRNGLALAHYVVCVLPSSPLFVKCLGG